MIVGWPMQWSWTMSLTTALDAPCLAIVADQLIADLRLIVRNGVRHRAVFGERAEEIFERPDLVAERLRDDADGIELQFDVFAVLAIDAEVRAAGRRRAE
jgi:hypothetical protein